MTMKIDGYGYKCCQHCYIDEDEGECNDRLVATRKEGFWRGHSWPCEECELGQELLNV